MGNKTIATIYSCDICLGLGELLAYMINRFWYWLRCYIFIVYALIKNLLPNIRWRLEDKDG